MTRELAGFVRVDPRHFRTSAFVGGDRHVTITSGAPPRMRCMHDPAVHAALREHPARSGSLLLSAQPATGGAWDATLQMCSGIAYDAAAGDSGSVLDFGGTSDVLFVGDGGVVTLRHVRAAGFALPSGRGTVVDSIVWPSVQLAPGGTVRAPISQWCLAFGPHML